MLARPLQAVGGYLAEVWSYRHFWLSLVRADLQRRYRRSALGLGWSLLQPLVMTSVLALVYSRLFGMDWRDYGPLLLTGLAFWNYLQGCVLQGCAALTGAEVYLRQQPLPAAIFPLRVVLTVGFHFLISLLLALVFAWIATGPRNPLALVSLLPSLVLLVLFGWSASVLAALAHVYFPDSQHLAELALQALFFLTPVMYPPALLEQHGLGGLAQLNPLAHLLDLIRQPVLAGQLAAWSTYAVAAGATSVMLLCAGWALSRLERWLLFAL
jgi:ABC-type polysaccharide/polyol phosphate export permease